MMKQVLSRAAYRVAPRVVQDVYPYAKPVPLTFMRSGQLFWGTHRTFGGWFRSSADLRQVLVRAGLPPKAPTASG